MADDFIVHVEVINDHQFGNLINKILSVDSEIDDETEKATDDMVFMAKILCPQASGNLADSIHKEGSYPNYSIVADAKNESGQSYGGYVEYGTYKMEARPFIGPAVADGMVDLKATLKMRLRLYLGDYK
jgi:HK97 gp10 family phage protein